MDDEYRDIAKICHAPNEKFYVLWQGEAVCTPTDALSYFETEYEARLFLAGIEDATLGESANLSAADALLTMDA
jgi:hypothetical protein